MLAQMVALHKTGLPLCQMWKPSAVMKSFVQKLIKTIDRPGASVDQKKSCRPPQTTAQCHNTM